MAKEIRLIRDGNMLAVKPLNDNIRRILDNKLSYDKVVFMYGEDARDGKSEVVIVPTACYVYKKDKLVTNTGFRELVQETLETAGYTVRYADIRPHTNPKVLLPQWDRLEGEDLRYRQREVLEVIANNDYARISCPTGYGKSYLVRLAARVFPKARIAVVVRSKVLCLGMYHELCGALPSVGLVGAGRDNHGRVQIYSADSLHKSTFDEDIVLVDEVHEMGAQKYPPLLARYRYAKMFGFSASHDMRLDKADFELHGMFGPIKIDITYAEGVKNKVIAPIEVFWHDVLMDPNPCEGLSGWDKEREGIARNWERNEIISKVAKQYGPDEQVLISVETIEHAAHLKGMLPDFEMCYAVDGMNDKQRDRFIRWGLIKKDEPRMTADRAIWLQQQFSQSKLKKVIANTVWNRGVDFKPLQVLIRADAGGSPINDTQIPGRVSRLHADKKTGVIHDFRDQFDPSYQSKAKRREGSYRKNDWEQHFPDQPKSKFRRTKVRGNQ